MESQRQTDFMHSFQCRKWTLFTFCVLGIVSTIVIIVVSIVLLDQMDGKDDYDFRKNAKIIIITVGVITILIEIAGLLGAYLENYCLTLTYAILMTIITFSSIASAVKSPISWFSFVLNVVICVIAYTFARDLRRLRYQSCVSAVYATQQPQTYATDGQVYQNTTPYAQQPPAYKGP